MNYGAILRDQSGLILNQGQGTDFLLVGPADKENVQDNRVELLQLPDRENEACGAITIVEMGLIEGLKYRGNIARLIREI